jgi:hypothetical protein
LALRDHQQLDAAIGFRALLLLGDVGLCHGATEAMRNGRVHRSMA